jgi:glycosyltransferase involved in cell wall biosynthesis
LKRVAIFLTVNPSDIGGLESYAKTLCQGLQSRGISVSLNGHSPEKNHDVSSIWKHRVRSFLPLMTRRPLYPVAILAAKIRGRKWCEEAIGDSDQVHFIGTGWDLLGFPLLDACRRRTVPMTCWPAIHPGQWGDSGLDMTLYRQVDKVFAQSEHERQLLIKVGVEESRTVRVGCAPTVTVVGNDLEFIRKYQLENRLLVLFVGRRDESKGYPSLRLAASRLIKRYPEIVLVSIGKSFGEGAIRLPPENELDLGKADDKTKQDALSACDLLCVPSSQESFGIVFTEAWFYGKPVICGPAPASHELITRHSGGLATDGSVEQISDAIEYFIRYPKECQLMGTAGQAAQRYLYNADYLVESHILAWQMDIS